MRRTLQLLFSRDPSRNDQLNNIALDGFQLMWPDRQPVNYGMVAFCHTAQRVMRLDRFVVDCEERTLELVQFPLESSATPMTRIPGLRVRRFALRRQGAVGRIHLINGAPTEITFELGRDEQRVLDWIGLSTLADGEELWFDFTAHAVDTPLEAPPGPEVGQQSVRAPNFEPEQVDATAS